MSKDSSTLRRRNLKTELSLWTRIKCFPSTLRRRNVKTQKSPVILDLRLRKSWSRKSHDFRDAIVFEKLRFQTVFPSTRKRKAGVFNFLRFEERFRKVPFSWRDYSVDRRPNRSNKARFSNSCDVVRRGLNWLIDSPTDCISYLKLVKLIPNLSPWYRIIDSLLTPTQASSFPS